MMRRKHWVIAAAILLLLAAGDVAYWGIASNRLRLGYQDWLAARTGEGWKVDSAPVATGGWPFEARVTIPSLTFSHAGSDMPGDVHLTTTDLQLSVALLHPGNLGLSVGGALRFQLGDGPEFVLTAGENLTWVPLDQTDRLSLRLQARNLRLEPAKGQWHLDVGLLNADGEVAPDQAAGEQAQPPAKFSISSEAIALPAIMKWPLGPNISSLSLDGTINGKLRTRQDAKRWAEAWRDGGGSLEITHLAMGWGPLGLTSAATVALDDQLQPMGSGSARLVGYAETLDRLAGAGVLTRSAATAAKAVLSLMAGTADGDTPSAVDVPLTLQYRTLSMRQVPLVRLRELDWPER